MSSNIVILAGDGVGPEVTDQAVRVLKAVSDAARPKDAPFTFAHHLIGGAAIDATGEPLPKATLDACRSSAAILLGAVGGPQWPKPLASDPAKKGPRPEEGILALRKSLSLYANLRPVSFASDALLDSSPLRPSVASGTDFVMVRELCGGVYFGDRQEEDAQGNAYDTMPYSVEEVTRVARIAGQLATQHSPPLPVHSIDKANVLATSRLWRRVVTEVFSTEFPSVPLDHHLVDSAAMLLVRNPRALNGVVLTENLFGDILSDEASVIPGSLGLLPSASLSGPIGAPSPADHPALYEPIHGSAPDIAGQGIANPIGTILSVALLLRYSFAMEQEARAVERAVRRTLDDPARGGKGVRTRDLGAGTATTREMGDAVLAALTAELAALSRARSRGLLLTPPPGRRPMNLCEKIIAHAALGLSAPGDVRPGEMVCVRVDWTLASELTWKGMDKTYGAMGRPDINRNDRFWLAVDHTVDPRINDQAKPRALIAASESFAKEAKIVDYYGPNQTILHTEFYRQRAQPGAMIIGADSHSCSAGGVGAFAVGLGAADVVMPLVTGETWFQVPETVEIRFVGQPPFGIGGKDAILYVLGELKRNTVAFERAVEYTGPGLHHLSPDARFAISNMTTEFGGIAGVFEADEQTAAFLAKRKDPKHKQAALYFRADPDAQYAESHVIDLANVESLVALYPSPDNVVPVSECAGMRLDGVFIGACTTAEEDLILAALVLEAGLARGWTPSVEGGPKRRVTPGSVPIVAKLRRLGLIEVYERAGFEIGAPGCSYCIAVAADHAGEGEVWLSSQNRNFKNRMGKGSIGNLASAATVAASSFDMAVRDPRDLLDAIDRTRYAKMLELWLDHAEPIIISEPNPDIGSIPKAVSGIDADADAASVIPAPPPKFNKVITGRAQVFGDHVDTDAIIPAQFMPGSSDIDLGTHAFQYFRPEFRDLAKQGRTIVVGGVGFGSGSSREEAPRALLGAGIEAVIARSYAFIYARNQPMMSLLGICLDDDRFYELATEDAEITIDVAARSISVAGSTFPFTLSLMEERLLAGGGVTEMYKQYGAKLFRVAMQAEAAAESAIPSKSCDTAAQAEALAW